MQFFLRLSSDYMIMNELKDEAENIIMAACTGHIVIAGIVSDNVKKIKDDIFNKMISENKRTYNNAKLLDYSMAEIIHI